MALEKKRNLRKMELIFTDDEIHPYVHCLYKIDILEDGNVVASSNHRENIDLQKARDMIYNSPLKRMQ